MKRVATAARAALPRPAGASRPWPALALLALAACASRGEGREPEVDSGTAAGEVTEASAATRVDSRPGRQAPEDAAAPSSNDGPASGSGSDASDAGTAPITSDAQDGPVPPPLDAMAANGARRGPVLAIDGERFTLDGAPFDLWGIRVASASGTAAMTKQLLDQLDVYKAHGVNTVTPWYMGSSGGNYDPFSADGTQVDGGRHGRMIQIIEAAAARRMVVIVGIFYQNAPFGLRDAEAVRTATRTVTRLLKPYGNVIINIANEQNSNNWADTAGKLDFRDPRRIVELAGVVRAEDPGRLVGGGGYDHAKNTTIGLSPMIDALLFDTDTRESSGPLYRRFSAAGIRKPIVNVEQFGAAGRTAVKGVFTAGDKAAWLREVDDAVAIPGLYTSFFADSWHQVAPYRYDLGGQGTAADPGTRWYFDYVAMKLGLTSKGSP
jgi:hypothetical protein